jgi:parallel beta-helix repeat protein
MAIDNSDRGVYSRGLSVRARDCLAAGNGYVGIALGARSELTACTAAENLADGIVLGAHSRVEGCTARNNNEDGIEVSDNSRVLANVARENGTSGRGYMGIRVTGTRNRIEGNDATGNNDVGIGVSGAGNVIIRNCCAGNAVNFDIGSGNMSATIVLEMLGFNESRISDLDYGNVNFVLP